MVGLDNLTAESGLPKEKNMPEIKGVAICKHCLAPDKKVEEGLSAIAWIFFTLFYAITGYFTFFSAQLLFRLTLGDLTDSMELILIPLSGIIVLGAITIYFAFLLIRNIKLSHYYFFLDKNGRLHCDTAEPLLVDGKYYWQMKNEVLALQGNVAAADFLISSEIIHWQTGGVRRGQGGVLQAGFEKRPQKNRNPMVTITRVDFPGGNPFIWWAKITLRSRDGFEGTAPLTEVLEFTIDTPHSIAWFTNAAKVIRRAKQQSDDATRTRKTLLDLSENLKTKYETAASLSCRLGQFLISRRNAASAWPQNSKYAREDRKAIDEFLAGLDQGDIESWKQPESAPAAPPDEEAKPIVVPPEERKPDDAAVCLPEEDIRRRQKEAARIT